MKKISYIFVLFSSILLSACTQKDTEENTQSSQGSDKLELLWSISGLHNPESVIYDMASDMLIISNVNGAPGEKNGNGYLTKALLDGTILKQKWVIGLNAPKGLAIHDRTLYVADIDQLMAIDIPSGTILKSYQVDDAQFLNDVAVNTDGSVFVSDMVLNRIHRLHEEQFDIWLESPQLQNPNGLHIEGDTLILGAWGVMEDGFATTIPGHLHTISLQDKSISSLGDGKPIGNLDGVESAGAQGYYVTDWMAGKLFLINKDGQAKTLLTLQQGMADLEVIMEQQLILLPMMQDNQLHAYKIK